MCPHIAFSIFSDAAVTNRMVSNPTQSGYNPHTMSGYSEDMTFTQRFENVFYFAFERIFTMISLRNQENIYMKYFPNSKDFKSIAQKFYSGASVVFVNSHYSIDYSIAYQPNLVIELFNSYFNSINRIIIFVINSTCCIDWCGWNAYSRDPSSFT
jgi:hypothetical protein